MQVHPRETERGRNQCARTPAVRREGFAVLVEPRVVAARTPTGQHFPDGGLVDAEKIGERLEVRRERDDDADVQVAVGPAIEPLADARRERIVHVRMTERALGTQGVDPARVVEPSGQSHHGVEPEQRERRGRVIEVDLARPDLRF